MSTVDPDLPDDFVLPETVSVQGVPGAPAERDVRAAVTTVLVSHSAIPSIMPSHLSDCLCGREGLTVTEHAKHVADELLSSGLVVPVGERDDVFDEMQRVLAENARLRDPMRPDGEDTGATWSTGWRGFNTMSRLQAIDTCGALVDMRDRAIRRYEIAEEKLAALEAATSSESQTAPNLDVRIPARDLSGEHVGRDVVLPDGTPGRVLVVRADDSVIDVRLHVLAGGDEAGRLHRYLAPDDVVTLVAETGGA